MGTSKNVPAIRFKGFEEEWEEKKLGEVADFNPKSELPSRFEYVDLESVVGTQMIHHRTEMKNTAPSRAQRLAQKGDLFYQTVRPYQKNNFLFELSFKDYVFSTGYAQLRPRIDSQLLLNLVQKNSFVKDVLNNCTGTSYPAISSTDLALIKVSVPYNKEEEQKKIGNYFKELDDLIQQQEQKLQKIANLKKAMLEKMFPKAGADVPEIRFEGYADKWEKKELLEVVDISSASRVHKNEWTTSGVPFFRSSDVVSIYKGLKNTKAYISNELYLKLSSVSGCVKKDDILLTGGGSIGIPYLIDSDKPLYFKDADLLWIKNIKNINGYFLYTFFLTRVFRNYIESITHIGTISHYTIEQAKSTPAAIPDHAEQQKIGEYFQKLDQLISQSQQKIEQLKHLKQALLQKMFI